MIIRYLYCWTAQTLAGATTSGEIIAASRQQAQRSLLLQGQFPLTVQRTSRWTVSFGSKVLLVFFTRQLATLLQAGITLQDALPLLLAGQKNVAWRWLLQQISQEIARGAPLSQALQRHPTIFNPLYCSLITVGELTGQLEQCCLQLALQQEKQLQLQRCIHKALFYPLFTLGATVVIALLMLTFVIPQFEGIYQSFNVDLPLFTRGILMLSRSVKTHGMVVCGVISSLLIGYGTMRQQKTHWQAKEQTLLLDLPLLGTLLHQHCLARLTRTLSITQSAGLSLLDSLQEASKSAGNMAYQHAISAILYDIQQGVSLTAAFNRQPLFPAILQQMIAVGETASALALMFTNAADFYEAQVNEQTAMLIKLLEPLMMITIGIIVGVLVVAIYLPIFQLGQVIP